MAIFKLIIIICKCAETPKDETVFPALVHFYQFCETQTENYAVDKRFVPERCGITFIQQALVRLDLLYITIITCKMKLYICNFGNPYFRNVSSNIIRFQNLC